MKHLGAFFVLGALILGAKALLPGGSAVVVTSAEVEQLRADWIRETRHAPAAAELEASVRSYADEEILVREALRLGLDRSDPVVRTRLTQNLRFARGGAGDDTTLFQEALALGMARRDLVARRRLVQAMEQRYAGEAAVTDAQVEAYVAAHPERYLAPARISFEQQFTPNEASAIALLPTGPLANQSEPDLARTYGPEFARAAMQVAPGDWSAPIRSAYGTHRIRVTAVQAGGALVANARREAWYALRQEAEAGAVRDALASLRRAYPLKVEWPTVAMQ